MGIQHRERSSYIEEHFRRRIRNLNIFSAEIGSEMKNQEKENHNHPTALSDNIFFLDDYSLSKVIELLASLAIKTAGNRFENEELCDTLEQFSSLLGFEAAALYSVDYYEHLELLWNYINLNNKEQFPKFPKRVGSPDGFLGSLWSQKSPILLEDLGGGSGDIKAFAGFPLFENSDISGALIFVSTRPHKYSPVIKAILFAITRLSALFLSKRGKNYTADATRISKGTKSGINRKETSKNSIGQIDKLYKDISHDFNNILGTIIGRAELLKSLKPEFDIKEGVEFIENAAKTGVQLVHTLRKATETYKTITEMEDDTNIRIYLTLDDKNEIKRLNEVLRRSGYTGVEKKDIKTAHFLPKDPMVCFITNAHKYPTDKNIWAKFLKRPKAGLIIIGTDEEINSAKVYLPKSNKIKFVKSPYRNYEILIAVESVSS